VLGDLLCASPLLGCIFLLYSFEFFETARVALIAEFDRDFGKTNSYLLEFACEKLVDDAWLSRRDCIDSGRTC
jgi:hypothetical protein